jgi:4-amino-4-deoxy-L-arabinose transferase-like glycosyltransferase
LKSRPTISDLNATSSASSAPLDWRKGVVVFLAVLALSLPQTALLPLLDRDEPRFSEASREMLQSGNFIVPAFNHAPRYDKPPLIYWCQAVSYTLFGENTFAARLPSLLATAGTAWLLFAWGAQLGSEQMGLGAALAYAFCLQTVQQGRVATADALLIFFMTLTAFAGWKLIASPPASHSSRSYFWDTILALGFAGGFLAKGPEAFLPFLPLLMCARGTRKNIMGELTVNFIIGLALVLFWAIPAYIETNGDYWRVGMSEGVGERMVTGLQGHGASTFGWYLLSVPLYLLLFWLSALPWSPLLVIHRKKLFTAWKPDRIDTYLLLNAGLIFVIFSLMVTKLPHYTLPAFPFLALVFARRWISSGLRPALPTKLAGGFGIALAVLTVVVIPIAMIKHVTPSPAGELVREAGNTLTPETEFALVDFQEPNAIWEMRRVVKGYGKSIPESEAFSFLNRPGPHAVILSTTFWQRLDLASNAAHPSWKIFEACGFNAAKVNIRGPYYLPIPEPLDLTLIIKP